MSARVLPPSRGHRPRAGRRRARRGRRRAGVAGARRVRARRGSVQPLQHRPRGAARYRLRATGLSGQHGGVRRRVGAHSPSADEGASQQPGASAPSRRAPSSLPASWRARAQSGGRPGAPRRPPTAEQQQQRAPRDSRDARRRARRARARAVPPRWAGVEGEGNERRPSARARARARVRIRPRGRSPSPPPVPLGRVGAGGSAARRACELPQKNPVRHPGHPLSRSTHPNPNPRHPPRGEPRFVQSILPSLAAAKRPVGVG